MSSKLAKWLPPLPLIFPAALSGVLVTICFPNLALGPLSFVALVPLLAAVMRRRPNRAESFRTGFAFGFAMFITMLWWIVKLIPSADVTIPWLMLPALVVLVLYLALFPAFFLLLLSAVSRWRVALVVIAAPALWILVEAVRARGELAFPWGALGYSLSYQPSLIQLASIGGLPLLSFAIVLCNALLAAAFVVRGTALRVAIALGAVVIVAGMWFQGEEVLDKPLPESPKIRVAVVQPNVDLAVKWLPEFKDSTLHLIERLATEAATTGSQLTIFPETSAPVYIEHNQLFKPRLMALARRTGVPFYIGFLDHRYDGPNHDINVYNSSGLFLPGGNVLKYDKNHLLPFGEALPLSSRLRWVRRINFGQANFQPGAPRPPLDAGVARFTPLICFESVFPYLCRRGVEQGSQLFVVITNDGWFSDTPGPYQHAQMCILRAVEFGRYLVRSANTGVSMIVTPRGQIVDETGLYVDAMLVADVGLVEGRTPYSRYGDWPMIIAGLVLTVVSVLVASRAGDPEPRH